MKARSLLKNCFSAVRNFIAPRYRPELHYMRGRVPLDTRRAILVDSKRVLPLLRNPPR